MIVGVKLGVGVTEALWEFTLKKKKHRRLIRVLRGDIVIIIIIKKERNKERQQELWEGGINLNLVG